MSISVRISKGKNISIQGSAQNVLKDAFSDLYSLNPIDFNLFHCVGGSPFHSDTLSML